MHMVIRAIVYAENEEEAIEEARRVFDGLVDDKDFDYYTIFGSEEDTSEMSGTGRWGSIPTVSRADSPEGQRLIEQGIVFAEDAFKEHLKEVRKGLSAGMTPPSAEELIEEDTWRWHCYCIGRYRGYQVWLYDNDGEGIRTRSHLKNVLDKWSCLDKSDYDGLTVYVVPADAHH